MNLFSELGGIEKMLDFHTARHGVLVSNMTNAETPHFEAKDLRFAAHMNGAQSDMAATQPGHIGMGGVGSSDHQLVDMEQMASVDGNGVSKDHTMAQATANRLRYEQGLELARRRLAMMRYGATDGGSS